MSKKIRYSLLVLGFVVFLILAPIIVLYVRGVTFDFSKRAFVNTGILAARVEPSNSQIYLDDELKRKNSGDVNFIIPDDYQVTIKSTGYNEWNKRLTIWPGQVTWVNPSNSYIYLLFSSPKIQDLSNGVIDFYSRGNSLVLLNNHAVVLTTKNNPSEQNSYPVPKEVNKILLADSAGENFILSGSNALLLFNTGSKQFFDLTSLFPTLPKFIFTNSGQLLALSNEVIYSIDVSQKIKTPLFNGVRAYYAQNSSLYFVEKKGADLNLMLSQAPFSDSQILIPSLPNFSQGDLLVTFEKQIFLLADGALFRANAAMQKLTDNVNSWEYNAFDSILAVQSGNELYYYGPSNSDLTFVSRSSEPFLNPVIKPTIGWTLLIKNNRLSAIELDSRGTQNQYALYAGKNIQKFSVDDAGKQIVLLDDGQLKNLQIR